MTMVTEAIRRLGCCRRTTGATAPVASRRLPVALALAAFSIASLSGCGNNGEEHQAEGRPGGAAAAQAGTTAVRGGPAAARRAAPGERPDMPAVAVAVEPATRGEISTYYLANATLEPEKQAEILARVSGLAVELVAEEGDFLKEGDILLRIEDVEYRHRLTQAEAEATKQRTRHERMKTMYDENLVTAQEYEAAISDQQAAEAALELAKLQLSYTGVKAPFSGHVVKRHIDPGQMVNVGTPLFSMADMNPLRARVHVPAKEFRSIKTEQPVKLTIDSTKDLLEGTITLVNPMVDPTSGTIKVTVEIEEYPETTRPGDFAEVRIVTDRHQGTVLVPKIAVINDKGEQVVYVAEQWTAMRRVVEIGFRDEEHCEILAGVAEGELVVVQGQRSLKDQQLLNILEPLKFERAGADEGQVGS